MCFLGGGGGEGDAGSLVGEPIAVGQAWDDNSEAWDRCRRGQAWEGVVELEQG